MRHGETGLTFTLAEQLLADNILTLLCDQYAKMIRSLAYRELLERFDWSKIALKLWKSTTAWGKPRAR